MCVCSRPLREYYLTSGSSCRSTSVPLWYPDEKVVLFTIGEFELDEILETFCLRVHRNQLIGLYWWPSPENERRRIDCVPAKDIRAALINTVCCILRSAFVRTNSQIMLQNGLQ